MQCTSADTSACSASRPLCDDASHMCVQCLADAACTSPTAPRCGGGHSCEACTTDAQCMRASGGALKRCDTGASPNTCVECTMDADCASGHCNTTDHTCFPPGTRQACESCDTDANCQPGH